MAGLWADDQPGENPCGEAARAGKEPGFSGLHLPERLGPARPPEALLELINWHQSRGVRGAGGPVDSLLRFAG